MEYIIDSKLRVEDFLSYLKTFSHYNIHKEKHGGEPLDIFKEHLEGVEEVEMLQGSLCSNALYDCHVMSVTNSINNGF